MAKSGPKPKPAALLRLRGSREDLTDTLDLSPATPDIPKWLSKEARVHWKQIAPMLEGVGVLTAVDGIALATLCDTLAQYVECLGIIAKEGMFYELETRESGTYKKEHPAACRAKHLLPLLDKGFQSFGLTPSARRALPSVKKAEEVAKDDFFSKRGRRKKA